MDLSVKEALRSGEAALYRDGLRGRWLLFEGLLNRSEIPPGSDIENFLNNKLDLSRARSTYLFLLLKYEAGKSFDAALHPFQLNSSDSSLGTVIEYRDCREISLKEIETPTQAALEIISELSEETYTRKFELAKEQIKRGDIYQLNLTSLVAGKLHGDPLDLFLSRAPVNCEHYSTFITLQDRVVCSLSPELFFDIERDRILCKPMKGTAKRGCTTEEDEEICDKLLDHPKNHAENVMIVDLMRNDLSKIADPKTVKVTKLFDKQPLPTVWQMTSTIEAKTSKDPIQALKALFPCGSVTGAPKVKAVEIAGKIEGYNRGLYTGTIGWISPSGSAQFNIAIRTCEIDRKSAEFRYGIGSGVVFDSEPLSEFQECRQKVLGITKQHEQFDLLESILWSSESGYYLLARHLDRLCDSARYFSISLDRKKLEESLHSYTKNLKDNRYKVRVLIDRNGLQRITAEQIIEGPERIIRLKIAKKPINSRNIFLYHKTTNRDLYNQAQSGVDGCDDVVLWNERNEITECAIYSLVVLVDNRWTTPPVSSGLLPGTMRAELLDRGEIAEGIITLEQLRLAKRIRVANSVRKLREAVLIDEQSEELK